ncbi:hypothetical protein Tco_0989510 [Tanacetum coccineum]|uniref:Uncharacterized protein n=1 Tax=Tanacetum coccineum TaxID=301880 RepID=A0ABQ5ETV4_9ASTR
MNESPPMDSDFDVPIFSPGDDPIACLNKAMAFLTAVASSRFPTTNNQLRTSSNPRNHPLFNMAGESNGRLKLKEAGQILNEGQTPPFLADPRIPDVKPVLTTFQTMPLSQMRFLDTYEILTSDEYLDALSDFSWPDIPTLVLTTYHRGTQLDDQILNYMGLIQSVASNAGF